MELNDKHRTAIKEVMKKVKKKIADEYPNLVGNKEFLTRVISNSDLKKNKQALEYTLSLI